MYETQEIHTESKKEIIKGLYTNNWDLYNNQNIEIEFLESNGTINPKERLVFQDL